MEDKKKREQKEINQENEPKKGVYKGEKDAKVADTHTDLYYKNEGVDPETGVEIPTADAVEEAKEWSDDENRR